MILSCLNGKIQVSITLSVLMKCSSINIVNNIVLQFSAIHDGFPLSATAKELQRQAGHCLVKVQ